jgi:cytochrome P450
MMDGGRHTRMRALVSRAFTPRRVAGLEARVRDIAASLLDRIGERGKLDLVADFTAPLPTIVIAELLGVPASDQAWFKEKSTAVAQFDPARPGGIHPSAETGPAFELASYLSRILEQRRADPRDDLLSALLAAEIEGERLTDKELLGFAFLLLVAGNETTTNLIGNGSLLLDLHPDQRRLLAREPARIATAVEEFLRYDSPVQGLARTTTAPVMLHGVEIPEGVKVLLLFGSANRDPRCIPDADRFDVTRDPNPHLAFGFGAHYCLGANLARLEARVAFEELLARMPEFAVDRDGVERMHSGPMRGSLRIPAVSRA